MKETECNIYYVFFVVVFCFVFVNIHLKLRIVVFLLS